MTDTLRTFWMQCIKRFRVRGDNKSEDHLALGGAEQFQLLGERITVKSCGPGRQLQ
jgi:hypothetical protein